MKRPLLFLVALTAFSLISYGQSALQDAAQKQINSATTTTGKKAQDKHALQQLLDNSKKELAVLKNKLASTNASLKAANDKMAKLKQAGSSIDKDLAKKIQQLEDESAKLNKDISNTLKKIHDTEAALTAAN